jgi:hypothetical protein
MVSYAKAIYHLPFSIHQQQQQKNHGSLQRSQLVMFTVIRLTRAASKLRILLRRNEQNLFALTLKRSLFRLVFVFLLLVVPLTLCCSVRSPALQLHKTIPGAPV